MKALYYLPLTAFSLLFIACAGGEKKKDDTPVKNDNKTELVNKYTKGEVYYVTLNWDETVTSKDEKGNENATPIKMTTVMKNIVEDVSPEGVATVKATYDQMKMGGFDSKDSTTFNDPMSGMMTDMLKREFMVKIDGKGNVLELTGAEGMYSFGMPDSLLDDNKIMKENMQNSLGIFPDGPVAVGEKWIRTVDITYGYPCTYKNEFTLKSADNGVAVIEVNSVMSPLTGTPPTIFPGGYELQQSLSGTQTGTIELDIERGKILKSSYHVKISGTATGKMGGKVMSEVPLSTDLKMEYTVQFGEK